MNSIGSAHADFSRANQSLRVSTPDRILFNIGSYLQWACPTLLRLVVDMVAGQSRSNSAKDL